MNLFATCLIILLSIGSATAQRTCATKPHTGAEERPSPSLVDNSLRDTLAGEVINVPVVVHILYKDPSQNISDAQVLSQIESLNKDFRRLNSDKSNTPSVFANVAADTKINFCLARIDPRGRPTNGIIRKYTNTTSFLVNDDMKFSAAGGDDAWNSKQYLNIWVCNLFGRNLGYATFPGGPAERDGIVILSSAFGIKGNVSAPYDKGRTVTHETGHWLGLKHIWGDADCGSDDVADTPPQKAYSNGCPSFPHTSSCSVNSYGDMFMNYMDFSDDACMNIFTLGQAVKMRSAFASTGWRNAFLSAYQCDSSQIQDGPLPKDTVKTSISISVYPNPVVNQLTLEIKNPDTKIHEMRIFSMLGKEVYAGRLDKSD